MTRSSPGTTPTQAATETAVKSNPEILFSIAGLNFRDQRFANGGNQFSVEPPDQGLCAGNGFVLETVNDVLRIFNSSGNALTGAIDLNSFYDYAPAIDRTKSPLQFGPSITDPSCYYDPDTQRWFHVVLTLDRANQFTQSLAGTDHLDIAVSTTADPTGQWVIYKLPVQNDGTQGTPDHNCRIRASGQLVHGPCLGDYPHIGADANGFYITTNEFDLATSPGQFHAAQIYAFSKRALAANLPLVNGELFNTSDPSLLLDSAPGFTVWPAVSPASLYDPDNGGTELLLSSVAVFSSDGTDHRLRVWSLTNTQSLDTTPALAIKSRVASVAPYSVPGRSSQKVSLSLPLLNCLADQSTNCFQLVGAVSRGTNTEEKVTSNDSRVQQVLYANGKLWGALDTGLTLDGGLTSVAGIVFFVLNPNSLSVQQQGYIALANNNVIYPALAVTPGGRGVMGFTLLGADHFPSAAYASIDSKIGAGDIHVASEGLGPDDGFSGYVPFATTQNRPRWGDYGAAVTDGTTIWLASESIEQTCTYDQYSLAPFGQCGGTRASLGNWGTRISKLFVGQ